MEIKIISENHKDYLAFVVKGLNKWERTRKNVEKIEVFHSSIRVHYSEDFESIPSLIKVHNSIEEHGLESFISISDMKNGKSIRYDLN